MACGGALFLNASKAALIIGLLILPWPFLTRLKRLKAATLFFLGVASLLLIAALLILSSRLATDAAFLRMTRTSEVSASFTGRMEAYQQYVNTVPAVGFLGLGPGTFKIAFPYQASGLRNVGNDAVHDFAHEDYLQTILEWGWLGAVWWFVLIAGGLYRAIKSYSQRKLFASKTEHHLLLAAILGVSATLVQALIDFPLQVTAIRLFFFVLLALCWASPKLLTAPPKHTRTHFRLPIPTDELIRTNSR
jgi:O-antigen ligase